MQHEKISTYETFKRLQHQERRINRIHVLQNMTLVAALVFGGTWFVCDGGTACWAGKTADANAVAVETEVATSDESSDDQVKWLKDHDEALRSAKKLGRPVLIDFAASWCVPCVMMDKHVWPDEVVQEALDSKVVPLRVDMDGKSAPAIIEKYKVEFVPTILLIDSEGKELAREGFVDAEQLLEMIKLSEKR